MAVPHGDSFFKNMDILTRVGSPFCETTPGHMLMLFHAFNEQDNLRRTHEGTRTCVRLRGDAERTFRTQYHLSSVQHESLVGLHVGADVGDVISAYRRSLPSPVHGARPNFVRRSFMFRETRCCNRALRLSVQGATFYDLAESYPVKHYAKHSRGGCGSAYYLTKKTTRGQGMVWHTFYAW